MKQSTPRAPGEVQLRWLVNEYGRFLQTRSTRWHNDLLTWADWETVPAFNEQEEDAWAGIIQGERR